MSQVEKTSLKLETRQIIGKRLRQLRLNDQVPAVIHDRGKASINVQSDYNTLAKVLAKVGRHSPVYLEVGSKKLTAMVKDVSFDPKKNDIQHVVFNAISANEVVEAVVPIKPKYDEGNESSPAERAGLIVLANIDEVTIEALPADLPSILHYDGEKLEAAGDQATAAELILPSGVSLKTEPEQVLATVFEPSALTAANDALAGDSDEEVPAEDAEDQAEESSDDAAPAEAKTE